MYDLVGNHKNLIECIALHSSILHSAQGGTMTVTSPLAETITTALAVADPLDLLALGCPVEEYDLEAEDLAIRVAAGEVIDAFCVMRVFEHWFGIPLPLAEARTIVALIGELQPC